MEPGDESILSHLRRGSVEYCVLALLRDGEAYGLDIGARLSADGILMNGEGTLYPLLARLRRRAPVAAALSGDAQAQAIADHLQWPISRVQTALQIPPSQDDIALRDRIRLLIQMRNQL